MGIGRKTNNQIRPATSRDVELAGKDNRRIETGRSLDELMKLSIAPVGVESTEGRDPSVVVVRSGRIGQMYAEDSDLAGVRRDPHAMQDIAVFAELTACCWKADASPRHPDRSEYATDVEGSQDPIRGA